MNRITHVVMLGLLALWPLRTTAQDATKVKSADERFKTDILVVVAHPDDEGGATPYLARAIYDEHKTVAVVFGTHGGSGSNEFRRESGPALADVREMEAREACAKLGITHVWFLSGKDTASQNVLNSLASWGHGENLEELVRIVRLTRPEVIITWLPGVFIGENHGDHQAAGVLATEAFDMAGDPAAFPAQVAGASKRLEPYLEGLSPWQPKKIYYFSDANDQKQFDGSGPAYSIKEVSPSQHKPYWRLALDAALPHQTQFPAAIAEFSKMSDQQLEKIMDDPNASWWRNPMTLIFGKSAVGGNATDDVFANVSSPATIAIVKRVRKADNGSRTETAIALGGPWNFYDVFRVEHGLEHLPVAKNDEIGIKAGSTLALPLVVTHAADAPLRLTLTVEAPAQWKVTSGPTTYVLPAEARTPLRIELETPMLSAAELKTNQVQTVTVKAEADGKPAGEVELRVKLVSGGLPQ